MSEQKYETLTLGQAIDAAASDEKVEWSANGVDWYLFLKSAYWAAKNASDHKFRRLIQPKKKLVPFTHQTWPIGAWVRLETGYWLADHVGISGVYLGGIYYNYSQLIVKNAKLLTIENGRVVGEKPCGLEVEE